jgi:serine/threonine protein kinase
VAHPEAVARFVREARASVRIQSEHVARVLDVGELENGAPYIVMEYLEGIDLAAALASDPPPPVDAVIEYVLQACEAVAEAHSLGIVHRDLKPANLFVAQRADGSPLVKVLDFGISKSLDGSDHALTKTTSFIGSPLYSSPEQLLSSRSVDARTDIWALGIILYEACAGHVPFTGESVMEVASRVMKLDPVPLDSLRPDLPPGLATVIMRCLEKDVARRFATVGDLARALAPYAPNASVSVLRITRMLPATDPPVSGIADTVSTAPPARSRVTPPTAPGSTQAEWDQRVSRGLSRPPSSRVGPVVLVLGALLVIASGAVIFVRSTPSAVAPGVPAGSAAHEPSAPVVPASQPVPERSMVPETAPVTPSSASASATTATAPPARSQAAKPHPTATPPAVLPPTQETPPAASPPPSTSPGPRNPLDIKIK